MGGAWITPAGENKYGTLGIGVEYDARHGVDRTGPMAGESHEAFGLGDDPDTIGHADADGVALAAIQELSERLDDAHEQFARAREGIGDRDDRIEDQQDRIDALERENEELRTEVGSLEVENDRLRERIAAVEDHLDLAGAADTASADE